jgi:UDP-GlcNAc:undecaprenyl-phosphate GlcNAc-1-phosphate transferase
VNRYLWLDAAAFAASFLISLPSVPLCRVLARRTGIMDVPKSEGHKLHGKATPLLGGVAILVAWLLPVLAGAVALLAVPGRFPEEIVGGFRNISSELAMICVCAVAAVVLGVIDDKHAMRASFKFAGQFVIAFAMVFFGGLHITAFLNSPFLTVPVSVFWIVFIMNAMNFFDNMDGLSVGTAAIAFLFFTAAAWCGGQFFVAALSACSAGACCGFWLFNKAPASIFMGDAGSHLVGFLLAVVSARVTYYNPEIAATRHAILIPLFILAVPIFDAFAVVLIRLHNHKPFYIGDHNHISHRFVRMGLTRPQAVRIIHLLSIVAGLGALPLLWGDARTCFVLLTQGVVILLILTLLQFQTIPRQNDNQETNHHEQS